MEEFKDSEHFKIREDDYVTLTEMGHLTEIQYLQKQNIRANIRKIDAEKYVVLKTGEIKEFQKSENRSDNLNSLRKTFKKLRYLINNNFVGSRSELFLTLTYRENMTDTKQIYKDFSLFMKRLRYRYEGLSYLAIIEPQERGAWHFHILIKKDDKTQLFISNSEVSDLWGLGFVRVTRLSNIDNIGAYLCSYLTDIIVDDDVPLGDGVVEKEVTTVSGERLKKKIKKNGRLVLYPPGVNYFRKSKGIVYPERRKILYKFIKKSQLGELTYEKNIRLKVDDFENMIRYEYYNKKR